jgi:hypothetical protein
MICDCPCFFLNLNDFSIMLTAGGPPLGVCRSGQAEAVCVSECPAAEGEGRTCTLQEQRVRQGCHPWTPAWASAPLHRRPWASCPRSPVQPCAGCIPPAPFGKAARPKTPFRRARIRNAALRQCRKWQAPIPEWCVATNLKMTTRAREMLQCTKPEIATTGCR